MLNWSDRKSIDGKGRSSCKSRPPCGCLGPGCGARHVSELPPIAPLPGFPVALAALVLAIGAGCDEGGGGVCGDGVAGTVLEITDGDTFKVQELDKGIRLVGVQAPETYGTNAEKCPETWGLMTPEQQEAFNEDCCFGEDAKIMLGTVLKPGDSVCLYNPKGGALELDMYQSRYLADVYTADGTWVNGKLVVGGYARYYDDFPHPTKATLLDEMEQKAQANSAGLWGACALETEQTLCP